MVVSPGGELLYYGCGQSLLDAVSLGLIDKARNRNGFDVAGKLGGVSGSMVATGRRSQSQRSRQSSCESPH